MGMTVRISPGAWCLLGVSCVVRYRGLCIRLIALKRDHPLMVCLSAYDCEASITKTSGWCAMKKSLLGRGERVEFECLNFVRVWREKWFVSTILPTIIVVVVIIIIIIIVVEVDSVVRDLQWQTGTKRKILGP